METTVLNCRIDLYDKDEAILFAKSAINEKRNFQIITINPEMIMNAQKDKKFFDVVNGSDLNIADGVGVKLALKLKGINQAQIRGVDFSRELLSVASKSGFRVAFFGAKDEVIKKAKENILKTYPELNFVYTRNGYFDFEKRYEIYNELKQANPQILLVGLGSPMQEMVIKELKEVLDGCTMIGVGGSFDVFSGIVKESPEIFRKLGLEWFYRTFKEPKRLKRIFPTLPIFLIKCIIDNVKKKG